MVTTKEPKVVPFRINQADGNIIAANGIANIWSDIWKYQVPQGTGIILQTGDQFSAYLHDGTAEVGDYDCFVKVEVRDPSEQDKDLILGPSLYQGVKEFQDRNRIKRIAVAKPVKVYPRQWITITVKDNAAVQYARSFFELLTSKVSVPL